MRFSYHTPHVNMPYSTFSGVLRAFNTKDDYTLNFGHKTQYNGSQWAINANTPVRKDAK